MLIVNIIAVTLLFIFLIFVINKKQKINTDYLLMIILVLWMIYLLSNIWVTFRLHLASFLFLTISAAFIFFPFVVFTLILIGKDHKFKPVWWWFAAFDGIYVLYVLIDIFVLNRLEHFELQELFLQPPTSYWLFYKMHGVYKIAVLIWLLISLGGYQKSIKQYFSNIEEISLNWLRFFIWVYIGENVISSLLFLGFDFGYIVDIKVPYTLTNTVLLLALFYLIYHGIRQYTLANISEQHATPSHDLRNQPSKKYQTSSLSEGEMSNLFDRIEALFTSEQIYHDSELKVQHIAQRLNVTGHNVSQTINQMAGMPFYEYVNTFRVNYFKDLLKDPQKRRFTILALGFESGFNSKASLNRIFKKLEGITPREYQQQAIAS